MIKPIISSDPMYLLLREGLVEDFNERRAAGATVDLRGHDLSRLDLRLIDARGIDFSDCYFRMADLRGVDFRESRLEGASFASAHVSGCYFPRELAVEEIWFSLTHGTRVRYR